MYNESKHGSNLHPLFKILFHREEKGRLNLVLDLVSAYLSCGCYDESEGNSITIVNTECRNTLSRWLKTLSRKSMHLGSKLSNQKQWLLQKLSLWGKLFQRTLILMQHKLVLRVCCKQNNANILLSKNAQKYNHSSVLKVNFYAILIVIQQIDKKYQLLTTK